MQMEHDLAHKLAGFLSVLVLNVDHPVMLVLFRRIGVCLLRVLYNGVRVAKQEVQRNQVALPQLLFL